MLLSHLVRDVRDAKVVGRDVDVRAMQYVSRRVENGSLFFAVPSVGGAPKSGGYRYIQEAVRCGACTVVAQERADVGGVTLVLVPDVRAAMADMSAEFFGHPSRAMHVSAVTGTDGKTTTTYLLEGILRRAGLVTGMLGTVETRIADERIYNEDRMTTPESLDVQRLLRIMADRGVTHVTLEASSHALALDRLRACRFSATAMTNITGDHVEFHGSFDAYVEAKRSLFADLAPLAPAILNRDDGSFATIAAGLRGPVYSYGFGADAEFQALTARTDRRSTTFELRHGQTRLGLFKVHLPGQFNVLNATAACLLASTAGLNWETIARGLAAAEGPPGRLQEVRGDAPFRVVVDYAHTPNAFRSVLSDLRQGTPGRLLAVFGATGNRDRSKRPLLGQIAGELADFFVITNEDPFGEDVDEIISEVAAGAPGEEEGRQFVIERDRMEAIRIALERARPDDTVVILGKGHERSIVVDGRREPWNDADAARAVLETLR